MTAQLLTQRQPADGLQALDVTRHLGGVAELIAVCFSPELEEGWHSAIRELLFLSRVGLLARLVTWLDPNRRILTQGFVWVEGGRVVGNVSTQPADTGQRTWLVANVAVHPDFRRRGLAHQLMTATLDHIRARGGSRVILQVDDDNLGALELYHRLGFVPVTTRHTWHRPARAVVPAHEPARVDIRPQAADEWRTVYALAEAVRPEGLAWNRPLQPGDFHGHWLRWLERLLNGEAEERWVAVTHHDQLVGSLWLQGGLPNGDQLTLLAHPAYQGQVERPLLIRALRRLGARPWAARIEHPAADQYVNDLLREFGFRILRTLRWMTKDLR